MILRRAVPADAAEVAAVHVRSWQVGYRGLLSADFLDGLDPAQRAERYTFDVADPVTTVAVLDSGSIVGFVTTSVAQARLMALYVDPDSWRCGVGSALITAGTDRLAAGGVGEAELWVEIGGVRIDERRYTKRLNESRRASPERTDGT